MYPNIYNIFKIYEYIHSSNSNKNLILEPFCTLIKLILLSYINPKELKYQYIIILYNT